MARSRKPTVWIEKRVTRAGATTWRVRAEKDGARLPDVACGPDRAHARQVRDKLRADLWAGRLGITARGILTVGDYAVQHIAYCRAHKAVRTVDGFDEPALNSFAEFVGAGRQLTAVTPQDLEDWKLAMLAASGDVPGLSPHTVGMRLRSIKAALGYAKRRGLIEANPATGMASPKTTAVGRVLLPSEMKTILEHLPVIVTRGVWFDINTGLRLSEVLDLDWRTVRTQEDPWAAEILGKGGKRRVVHLNAAARAVMGKPAESGRVFAGLSADMIHSNLVKVARKHGLGRVRFHDLRHTWATEYMRRTGDLPGLMLEGGWSTLAAVRVYQHLSRARAAAVETLDFGVSPPILPPNASDGKNGKRRKA